MMKNKIFKSKKSLFLLYLGIFLFLAIISYLFVNPLFMVIYQILRITLIGLTTLFIFLSILVFVGLRDQAVEIIKRVIDGSLTSIDIYEALKDFLGEL